MEGDRRMKMTGRERIMCALNHGTPDRVPATPDISIMIPTVMAAKSFYDPIDLTMAVSKFWDLERFLLALPGMDDEALMQRPEARCGGGWEAICRLFAESLRGRATRYTATRYKSLLCR